MVEALEMIMRDLGGALRGTIFDGDGLSRCLRCLVGVGHPWLVVLFLINTILESLAES